jgi:hypothetical protein
MTIDDPILIPAMLNADFRNAEGNDEKLNLRTFGIIFTLEPSAFTSAFRIQHSAFLG